MFMKKILSIIVFVLLTFVSAKSYAFSYTISFTGTGVSTTVDSVIVQNLTKGTSIKVPAGNTLNLYDVVSSIDQTSNFDDAIYIYPNPIQGIARLSFFTKQAGSTQVNVFGVDGRNLKVINTNLKDGNNTFQLSLAPGAYIIKVNGNGFSYVSKVISQSNSTYLPNISHIGNEKPTNSQPYKTKNGSNVTSMIYTIGDQLLYKGISGKYSTNVTDKPTESKTTNFDFVECVDADGNNYSVVKIGTQVWMAENLNTTKYQNGEQIANILDANTWSTFNSGAWCNFNNDLVIGLKYGKLYNKYAFEDSRNIAPMGWHVSNDSEWTTLASYLGGESLAGGKLKATGTELWLSPNTGATNETGFSAIAGGGRFSNNIKKGYFASKDSIGSFWQNSGTQYRQFSFNTNEIKWDYSNSFTTGLSVRCVKNDIPSIYTPQINSITSFSANIYSDISSDGGSNVTSSGYCWSTIPNPTTADFITSYGLGTNPFSGTISNLNSNTTYYLKAYATNDYGTAYSEEISFTTLKMPFIVGTKISTITDVNAISGGNVISDGGSEVTARGVCWSQKSYPTIDDTKTIDASGTGAFTSIISGLSIGTRYYVRAYATNSDGTSYGNEESFVTNPITITTLSASSITVGSAESGGEITNVGNKIITERGVCVSTTSFPNPTIQDNPNPTVQNFKTIDGSGGGKFSSALINYLVPNTTYYIRAYATIGNETFYGEIKAFITKSDVEFFYVPQPWYNGYMIFPVIEKRIVNCGYRSCKGGDVSNPSTELLIECGVKKAIYTAKPILAEYETAVEVYNDKGTDIIVEYYIQMPAVIYYPQYW